MLRSNPCHILQVFYMQRNEKRRRTSGFTIEVLLSEGRRPAIDKRPINKND